MIYLFEFILNLRYECEHFSHTNFQKYCRFYLYNFTWYLIILQVKKGSCVVGVKGKEVVVLACEKQIVRI